MTSTVSTAGLRMTAGATLRSMDAAYGLARPCTGFASGRPPGGSGPRCGRTCSYR
jgi:hypothetical protein